MTDLADIFPELEARKENHKRRALTAMALRGLADIIENAELSSQHAGHLAETGASSLDSLSFGFEIGNYLAEIVVVKDAFIAQLGEGDCETNGPGGDVVGKGHFQLSIQVDVEGVS